MTYEIRRYSHTSYGESIFKGTTLKECLAYLRDIFESNKYTGIERHDFTFIAGKRLYRIYKY